MGWEEFDPLKQGTRSTPKTPTPFLFPTPKPQNPPSLLTPPNPFSSSRLSSPLPVLQLHRLFGSTTSPGRAGRGTPTGCGSARPRAGILLQPPQRCRQWCQSGDSWECNWGTGFAEARPLGQGGNQKGWRWGGGRGARKGSAPAWGIFRVGHLRKGWGPLPGVRRIRHHCWHVGRGGVCCPFSPGESHAEATKSSQPSLPVSLSDHGVPFMGDRRVGATPPCSKICCHLGWEQKNTGVTSLCPESST